MKLLVLGMMCGCALNAEVPAETATATKSHCASPPRTGRGSFRSIRNRMFARLGDPRHRGIDLIALESDPVQTIAGKLAYTAADKDLGHEDVELYACVDDAWKSLATLRTDKHGRFRTDLAGDARLPPGTRDLFAYVAGDGTGVRFLAYVAKAGESVIVTDIDGTITASENAVLTTVLFGDDIGHRLDAPQVLAGSDHKIVYVSARGDQMSDVTRRWLRTHGFPDGPMRLAPASLLKPGPKTVAFKTAALRSLSVPIHAAIGNKPTDVESYASAGIPASRIFVKLPEFEGALRGDLAARRAIGFTRFAALPALLR
ncbi:MAG: hypothetical protein ABI867_11820 [Kofleriaceae bacterium]